MTEQRPREGRAAGREPRNAGSGGSSSGGGSDGGGGHGRMKSVSVAEEANMLINLIGQLSKSQSQHDRQQQKEAMQRELQYHDAQVRYKVEVFKSVF